MPVETNIESKIPAIYKRSSLNLLMYGFVTGARSALHTITIKQAVSMFMEEYRLSDDEYNIDSALITYNRMQKEASEI